MSNICKICGESTVSFYHDTFRVTYHECEKCAFIFKDPEDLVSTEEEYRIYESHENSIDDPGYVAYLKRFIDTTVMPYETGDKVGFDFGSGPSPVLSMIMKRDYGFKMDIYDLFYSPERVFEGKTYDVVTSTEVVEHLSDPLEHFRIMKKALKENGILAIQTQLHPNDVEKFKSWYYMRDRSHIAFYTSKTMEKIAELLELELIFCDEVRYITFRRKENRA